MTFEQGTSQDRRVFLVLLALFLVPIVRSEILEVPTVYLEVQDALDLAMEGDTVLVLPGVYPGHFEILDEGVTLASRYLFSGDTTDIGSTVLDGGGTGCVLRVDTPGNRLSVVHGITVRNGLGFYGGSSYSMGAGGIQLGAGTRAVLRQVRLEHNRAPRGGAALTHPGRFSRLELDHVRLVDNLALEEEVYLFPPVYLNGIGSVRIGNLECPSSEAWPQMRIYAYDSLVLHDLLLDGLDVVTGISHELRSPRVVLERITIRNLRSHLDRVLYAHGSASLVASDIRVLDNIHEGPLGSDSSPILDLGSSGEAIYSGIRFERNRVPHPIYLADLEGSGESVVRDLVVSGNTLGLADTLTQNPSWLGSMVRLGVGQVEDVLLQDNLRVTPRLLSSSYPGGFPHRGAVLELRLPEDRDTVLVRGLAAFRNLVEDLDVPTSTEYQNTGMVLRFAGSANSLFTLEDGDFRENTSSHIPAPPGVSSNAPNSIVSLSTGHFRIQDCLFLDNPVGAMSVYGTSIDIRNVQQVNPGRNGLLLNASTITARNVLVQGVQQPPDIPASNSACAFQASAGSLADIWNCSITDCNVRSLFTFSGNNSGQAHIRSCILSGNQATHLVHEGGNPPVIQYRYCLYDQLLPGTGNLVAEDHGMSSERMRREFVPGSPCIDGGEPAAGWNDVAAIDLPETPAYPSSGTLRNDVGHLGGPSAKPLPCFDARPAPPTIWITRLPGRVRLEWEEINQSLDECPANVLGYRILWAGDLTGPWQVLAETGSTFLEIPLVAQQPRRFFRVISLAATER